MGGMSSNKFSLQHRIAHAKNYALLVNKTPVDDILDELRQQKIVNEEQREFIARHSTHKGRTLISSLSAFKYTSLPR
jgi:hypothetical protein